MNKFNNKLGNLTVSKLNMNKLNNIFYTLFIVVALTSTSFSASANRPAMAEETANIAKEKIQQEQILQAQQRQAEAERAARQVIQPQTIQQPAQVTGDVLVLPPKEMQAGETINIKKINTPRRGITMEAVRRQLGEPISTSASVGQPPITRWAYKDRIVYFEYSTVLHVVAR